MSIIGYVFLTAPYLVAILLAMLLVGLVIQATQSPWVVLGLLAMAMVAETATIHPLAINLGLWVYPGDAFAAATAVALLLRVVFMGKFREVPTAWWVFGAAQFVMFVWGLATHGTGAGVDYRAHFSAWAGAAYLATFVQDDDFIKKLLLVVQLIAWSVMAVAVYRWVGSELDAELARDIDRFITTGVDYRVLWVTPTFMISVAMLTALFYAASDQRRSGYWPLVLVFGAFVLALQHRTVWATALIGLGTLGLLLSRARTGTGLQLVAVGLGLGVLVAVMATGLQGVSGSIQAQAERAVSGGGTFYGGRVLSWVALLQDWIASGSPTTYLLGHPFGSGYERYITEYAREAVTYQPHNYYVQLLYRGGLIGLVAFLWAMGQAFAALRRQLAAGEVFAPLLLALFASLVLYYVPYGASYDHAIFLGLMLGASNRSRSVHGQALATAAVPPRTLFARRHAKVTQIEQHGA